MNSLGDSRAKGRADEQTTHRRAEFATRLHEARGERPPQEARHATEGPAQEFEAEGVGN